MARNYQFDEMKRRVAKDDAARDFDAYRRYFTMRCLARISVAYLNSAREKERDFTAADRALGADTDSRYFATYAEHFCFCAADIPAPRFRHRGPATRRNN